MTYTLDIELDDLLGDALDNVVNEMEDAFENIRRHSRPFPKHTIDVDVHELLAGHQSVALVFTIEDVREVRPDLSDGQAWDVLRQFRSAAEDCPEPLYETIIRLADMAYPNRRRARPGEAAKVIAGYGDGDERENLVDLLRDAMLWCEGFGEPFDGFCGTARIHFAEASKKGA